MTKAEGLQAIEELNSRHHNMLSIALDSIAKELHGDCDLAKIRVIVGKSHQGSRDIRAEAEKLVEEVENGAG